MDLYFVGSLKTVVCLKENRTLFKPNIFIHKYIQT